MKMAFEIFDPRGFLFLVLFAIPMVASRNIDCHGRGFHCVNSTHFMICVDLGIGISTTIDDFIIPCPLTTVCDKSNIFECEFPKYEVTVPPLQVIGVTERSVTSEATVVSTSATSVPLVEVSSVTNKPVSISSIPEEVTPAPELEVLRSLKDFKEAYNETSTTAEVTVQTTPSSVLSEKATVDSVATIPDTVNSNSDTKAETTFDTTVTVSISNNTTTSANEMLDSTLSTPAPTVNAGSAVDNSYRTDKGTINQNSDNNALHQNYTGLKEIGESTTTEKIQMSSTSALPSMTETKFTMTGENETKTTEVTSRHDNDEAGSNVNDTSKSTIAPMNYLRTTGKLPDSNPIMNTDTEIVDKIAPSSTSTTLNPSIDFTNVPYLKFEISKTIVNVTTNAANNDTSSTTVSFNISGVVENHAFVNNGLMTPSFKNDVPQPIATKNIQGGYNSPNVFDNPQEVMVRNTFQNNVPNENKIERKNDASKRIPDNLVQDKVNLTTINIENIANSNETIEIQKRNSVSNAIESFQPIAFSNSISNTVVGSQESKTTILTSNVDTTNLTSTNLENLLTNISTRGRTIENVTDINLGIINNNNVPRTDSKIENNISTHLDLSENNKTILTNPSETNRRNRILEVPKQTKNTVEEINKNELTDSSHTYTETVSEVINSSMNANSTKVPNLNTTFDQFINKTYNLIDIDNNIARLEPTVIVNVGEITIPTPIPKTTNTSEDLPLNSAPTQTSLNETIPLNITGKTVLRENTDNAIVKHYTQEVKTIIENMPEVPIPNNVTDENTQIDSINVLKANESDTTIDNITSSISTLTTTTPSTILIDTTLTPVPTNVMQTVLNEITTISSATILDATANSTSESTLEPVSTTDATQITVLRDSKPAEKNQTNDPNRPLETNVDFNKTKSGDDLTRAPQLIIQQTEPTLPFESMTSSPSVTTVPEIQTVTEFTVTNSSNGLVDNLTLTQGNDTTTTGDSILTAESEVINTVENVATNVNQNNSSYVRNGEVLATEVSVESTTSSTNSSIISITQNQREEATSTVETSQTQTTHSPFQLAPTDVVPEIKETNETRSIIIRDGFNSTVTQDTRTNITIVKKIIVDDPTGIEAPIINQDREILPSTPNQETKTLRSVASTSAPIASTKENVTFNLRDDKANNLTNSENNITIVKQEIFLPFQDVMGDNPPMAKTTPIMNYEEVKLENVNSNVQLPQQPPIKQIPERNNFVYGISNLSPVVAFLTPTVKLSDASFIYIIPSVRRTDEPLDQSSNHFYNPSPFNKVTTQPVLNSVTAPDSMVETIPVNGAKIIEKSHLGLVLNDTRVKNLTVDSNYGGATAKHIEKIENVTTTAVNLTELHDIDQNINKEKALTQNDGNMNVNITKEIFSNTEIASNYRKLIPDIQDTRLSTESPVDVSLPQNSLNNTAENEKMSTTTNMAHVSSQKESREILKPANNNYVNLENNNVTFVKSSITNISQDFETPNKLKTSTTINNQEVKLEEHNQTQRNVTGNELKHNTTIKPDFEQTVTNKQLHASNKDKNNANATATTFNCSNHTRGKYADKKDCRKFYTCVGNLQPLVGICPNNTVFSDINKQCTRNLSHCVRNNQFRCSLEGRFKDFFKDNIYYICVKNTKKQFIRYKFQCNSDYHLNTVSIKCEKNAKNSTQAASSGSENSQVATDESRSAIAGELSKKKYNTQFECEDEGSFSHSNDCNKYYECTKVNEVYRRKLKKCGSNEVYDKDKKKCIKSDSTEC